MTISLAFVAPGLVVVCPFIGVAALRDAPAEWSLQYERLGLINSLGSAAKSI